MRAWLICLLGGAAGSLACRAPAESGVRTVADLRDTVWSLVASATDTVLLNPVAVAAGDGRVYLADLGGPRLVAFDVRSGELLWTFGHGGAGPGEFTAPGSLTLLPNGHVAVADRIGARITIVSREGRLVATRSPQLPDIHAICAPARGRALVYSAGSEAPFSLVDLENGTAIQLHTPWPAFDSLPALTRQVHLASSTANAWCWIAMIAIGQYSRYLGAGFEQLLDYVEPVPIPAVDTRTVTDAQGRVRTMGMRLVQRPAAAQAAAADGEALYVVYGGETADANRLIDVYLAPGQYHRSLRLGSRAQGIAVAGGTIVVLTTMEETGPDGSRGDPYPALVALRVP